MDIPKSMAAFPSRRLFTKEQRKPFEIVAANARQILLIPEGGKQTVRTILWADVETALELRLKKGTINNSLIRDLDPETRNASYLTAITDEIARCWPGQDFADENTDGD